MHPMIGVIGVHRIGNRCYSKHSGKDEFAKLFIPIMRSLGVQYFRRAFGDALKEDIAQFLDISVTFLEANKADFVRIMQGYGTDYARKHLGHHYWIDRLDCWLTRRSLELSDQLFPEKEITSYIVPDVRFKDEAAYIKRQGGVVVRVTRTSDVDYFVDASSVEHISENTVDIPYDVELLNVGSLVDFDRTVAHFTLGFDYAYKTGKLNEYLAQGGALSRPQFSDQECDEISRQARSTLEQR